MSAVNGTAAPSAQTPGDSDSRGGGDPVGGAGVGREQEQEGVVAHAQSRLIVEALVVRKMSLDEAFLDFGGFALI
ncbi:hypothetical protein H0H81_008565 [Sphagnurus paluster]|uniref:Uncharacterized protein n=1 Tax=Sphagnurus paluster TaxID=117069 RepID=A0A9P7FPZ5_9AGAR|nr:hypothetical protein H0H81_008565 [Sphagnurus paluster]